jgi:nucleoside-diphosphate-sugar epimerase
MLSGYENKTAFITGATGFIGGRLAEVLATECQAHVKALVRDFSTAIRIGRLPIDICRGDVTNIEQVREAIRGADFVFHCAYGNKGDTENRCGTTIRGTENVLIAAREERVKSFVFLSTQSVYGNRNGDWIDEGTPKNPSRDQYAQSKLQAERIVQRYYEMGLKTIIIQPTAVYGPWAPSYGERVFDQLHENLMPLIDGGLGICNAVYVDDLVYAILLAAINEKSYGESFLINGAEYCTWKDFWGYFESIIGAKRTKSISRKHALRLYRKSKKRPSFIKLIKIDSGVLYEILRVRWISKIFLLGKKVMPNRLFFHIKRTMLLSQEKEQGKEEDRFPGPFTVLDPSSIDFFTAKTKVSNKKAMEILNYRPRFSLSAGFERTEQWYKWFYSNR